MARKKQAEKGRATSKGRGAPRSATKKRKRACKDLVDHDLMQALSNRLRAEILAILAERVASPKEMAEETGESVSVVSYHVRVLLECRAIELDRKEPRRRAVEHFYRAVEPTLLPLILASYRPAAPRTARKRRRR